MSTVTFRYEKSLSKKTKKGNKTVKKEILIDGAKGLTFSFLHKDGDDDKKFYKIFVKSDDMKKFVVTEKKGEKETTSEKTKGEVEKLVKGNKDLAFTHLYMTKGPDSIDKNID